MGALAMVGALASPVAAKPLEIEWVDDLAVKSFPAQVVVDPVSGDPLSLLPGDQDGDVLRRLDAGTGAVEWTVPVPGTTKVVVDPSTGQVVLAGSRDAGQVLTLVPADGTSVREVASTVPGSLIELAVDTSTGQICTLSRARRRSDTPNAWVTACWTSSGQQVFVDTWTPPPGQSLPTALAIDPRTHRVYTAGTTRPRAGRHKNLVLLAHDASGARRWKRTQRGAFVPSYQDIAVDPRRGRIHVVNRPLLIESPVQLHSFDARGRLRFSRSWEDLGSVYETAVQVTPEGHVLVVASGSPKASLRAYAPSGRLLSKAVVRSTGNPRENYLEEVAIDPRRELAHLLVGGGDTPISVATFTFRGKKRSSTVVDDRDAIFGYITVDPGPGRVYTSVGLFRGAGQRITALR